MHGSAQRSTIALIKNLRMIFYREARDFCKGFYANPQWFLMRKIGRFDSVKTIVSWCRLGRSRRELARVWGDEESEIFQTVDVERVVDTLHRDGLCLGLDLPADIVDQIVRFAQHTLCYGNGKSRWGFYCDEKSDISRRFNLKLTTKEYHRFNKTVSS